MNEPSSLDDVRRTAQERDSAQTLQRTLSSTQLITLGIGAIIGAGIFVTTGTVAAHHTGPAIIFSFALAAMGCLCAGLCYAEFAAMMPVSGSAYSYVYATFGRATGWMIAWCLILEYLMAGAVIASGWSSYFLALLGSFGMEIAPAVAGPALQVSASGELMRSGAVLNAPAVALLLLLTGLSLGGVRLSVRATGLLVAVKLLVIGLFIICGAFFVDAGNWQPFLPSNTGEFGEFGWSGVLRGAAVVFYAFLGFDAVSTAARETRNPQRNVPIGLIGSVIVCTLIYIVFSLVLTGLAPYTSLAAPNPLSVALASAGPRLHFLKVIVEIGAVVGLISTIMVLLYAQSRVVYALAQSGLVPSVFGKIGQRSKAPWVSVLGCGFVSSVAASILPVDLLGQLISIGTLCAFVFVCASVLVMRVRKPELERPFRVPYAPVIGVAGIAICGYLMASLSAATWSRFVIWLILGAVIYAAYGRRHAHLYQSMEPAKAPPTSTI